MKRLLIVTLAMVIMLGTGVAFAGSNDNHDVTNNYYDQSTTNQGGTGIGVGVGIGGAGGNATILPGAIVNSVEPTLNYNPTFNPTNKVDNKVTVDTNVGNNVGIGNKSFSPSAEANQSQGQKQGQKQQQQQGQIQGQMMNNKQTIAPVQQVLFESPTPLLNTPSQSVPELNFGNGKMIDATKTLPNFAIYGITPLTTESIREVLNVNANVKFKNLYKAVLNDAKDVAEAKGFKSIDVRYQIIRAEAQKTWTTGGNLGGGGSTLATSGLSGVSGAGSIVPQFGGTKADDLFTIIFVKVIK